MASEWNPDDPADASAPGGTMVAVPRVTAPAAPLGGDFGGWAGGAPANEPAAPAAGGTMVGIRPIGAPVPGAFGGGAAAVPPAGGTMVGIRPIGGGVPGAFGAPAGPAAAHGVPEAGGTMVGIRPIGGGIPGAFGAPAGPSAARGVPEAGGTMVGIRPIGGGIPGAFGAPLGGASPAVPGEPAAGGTMVGIRPLGGIAGTFTAGAQPAASPESGGTMVGLRPLGGIAGAFTAGAQPAASPESGGTMVGLAPIGGMSHAAPVTGGESGGTMVGLSPIGGGFAAPAVIERPAGPPPAYEIVAHLGGDEVGQVFHARERETGNDYALRLLSPELVAIEGLVDTMRQVAEMAQAAEHTHLGRLWALDETATPALVLEFVPGKSLFQLLSEKGAAPAPAVVDLGIRLGSAIAAAHAAGLAHGNVHTGNVILEAKTGRWVLLDVAQRYALAGLDPLDDLYALGTLLYQMASGRYPFENPEQPVPDPRTYAPKVPPALAALLLRSLQPDPALRFQSAQEFVQALARARGG